MIEEKVDEAGMAEEGEVCVFKGGVSFQGDGGLQELQIVFFFFLYMQIEM